MLKVKLLCVVMASGVINFNVKAEAEFSTLSFQGEIAEPSCYYDLSTISCYDQNLNEFISQTIMPQLFKNTMKSENKIIISTKFKQINNLFFSREKDGGVTLSLNYN
ncbi:hypothetical protein [Vibrio metschnikovii]|uniref:hypothetical protein n=1 Tax=Vibrio metschnikovii TaxID=28172 RepID=UPI001C310F57|nr:hypothetical protein [Vibrio metschnikovii]